MFGDSIQYKFTEPWTLELELGNTKRVTDGTYTRRELIDLVERKVEITQFDKDPQIKRMNKLEGITEVVFDLDELDNSDNFEDGSPSNTLFTYHVTSEDFTRFEPYIPQYKKLKNGELVFLVLRITHIKNNIMTNGLAITVVLHIQ